MSDLFRVRLQSIEPLVFIVQSVHPDSGPVPDTPTFAFMLLLDPIADRRHRGIEFSPLALEVDLDKSGDENWIRANARAFVKRVSRKGSKVVIETTHPAWRAHLKPGMKWDTAAYDAGPGQRVKIRSPRATSAGRAEDPKEGFVVTRIPATWAKKFQSKVARGPVPTHPVNRYVADPNLKGASITPAAFKPLIGKAILVQRKRGPAEIGILVSPLKTQTSYDFAKGGKMVSSNYTGFQLYQQSPKGALVDSKGIECFDLKDVASVGQAWLRT